MVRTRYYNHGFAGGDEKEKRWLALTLLFWYLHLKGLTC